MIEEIWLPLVGYENYYEVSNLGEIKSLDRQVNSKSNSTQIKLGRILKPNYRGDYLQVAITKESKKKYVTLHRLIAITFISNPENKPCVNHIDGCKTNNAAANLEWVTYSENSIHAVKTGLNILPKGIKHPQAKLTPEIIQRAKQLKELGHSYESIGLLYGVSLSTIYNAIQNKSWKHLNISA